MELGSDTLNNKIASLDDAPDAYAKFDKGSDEKYIIDRHGMIKA